MREDELAGRNYVPRCHDSMAFLSYDAVNRLCLKRDWSMRDGIGIILWVTIGFAGGAYIMMLFNLI